MTEQTKQEIPPLHDYQIFAKHFVITHPYCGLFFKMGLGKTRIVLEALWELNPSEKILIVAPKSIAKCTWDDEIEKWGLNIRTKSLVLNEKGKDLTAKQRNKIYDAIPTDPPTIYFINQDMLANIYKRFPDKNWPFRIIIIDESQGFKSYSSVRFKTMQKIRPWISRLILLSGSPTPKGIEDIWSQIWMLDMGARLGPNITYFRRTYMDPGLIVDNHPVSWKPKPGAEPFIYTRIADLVISMKNTRLPMPPCTINPITTELNEPERMLYKRFMKEYVIQLTPDIEIEAPNAAVLSAKLSQMASGAIYTNPKQHEYAKIHEHKLELCKYIIDNTDDNVIIAYHFTSDKLMLMDFLQKNGYNPVVFDGSPQMKKNWDKKKYPIMLLQPASCGKGLNLQDGGATLIWYTLSWSLEDYEQTNARINRQGQTKPVTIHILMINHTIDQKIYKALKEKDVSQERLISAVEVTLEEAADMANTLQ